MKYKYTNRCIIVHEGKDNIVNKNTPTYTDTHTSIDIHTHIRVCVRVLEMRIIFDVAPSKIVYTIFSYVCVYMCLCVAMENLVVHHTRMSTYTQIPNTQISNTQIPNTQKPNTQIHTNTKHTNTKHTNTKHTNTKQTNTQHTNTTHTNTKHTKIKCVIVHVHTHIHTPHVRNATTHTDEGMENTACQCFLPSNIHCFRILVYEFPHIVYVFSLNIYIFSLNICRHTFSRQQYIVHMFLYNNNTKKSHVQYAVFPHNKKSCTICGNTSYCTWLLKTAYSTCFSAYCTWLLKTAYSTCFSAYCTWLLKTAYSTCFSAYCTWLFSQYLYTDFLLTRKLYPYFLSTNTNGIIFTVSMFVFIWYTCFLSTNFDKSCTHTHTHAQCLLQGSIAKETYSRSLLQKRPTNFDKSCTHTHTHAQSLL